MDIGDQLKLISTEMKLEFTLSGQVMPMEEVFAEDGYLPAFIKRADQLCEFCLGHNLGVEYKETEGTRLGKTVQLNDKVSTVLRLMCAVEILHELMENSYNRSTIAIDYLARDL